jgi:hypothetical protein
MKHILLVALLGICSLAGISQAEPAAVGPFETDLKLNELASLPQGLTVVHTPDAVATTADGPTGSKWPHSTTVSSTVGPVVIVEFGCLYKEGEHWKFGTANKAPYTADNFAEWYGCQNAEMQPGATYTDASNFSLGHGSPDQAAKWYFIGVDAQGNRVKGEADVKLLKSMDGC